MAIPNPSVLVRKQSEAVSAQFDQKKTEIVGQISTQIDKQLEQVKENEQAQLDAVDSKIGQMQDILNQMDTSDPRRDDVIKNIGLLKEQYKQIKAQVKLAIASIKANGAREKENIKSRIEREKSKAVRSAVEAALSQFSMMMQKQRIQKEGAVGDELRSGNRG